MEIGLNFTSKSQYTTVRCFENWPEQTSYTINWTYLFHLLKRVNYVKVQNLNEKNYEFYLNIHLKIEKSGSLKS